MIGFIATVLILAAFGLWAYVRVCESPKASRKVGELRRWWKSLGVPGRILAVLLLIFATDFAGTKEGPTPIQRALRFLFWDPYQPWVLQKSNDAVYGAEEAAEQIQEDIDFINETTTATDIYTISFNWDAPDRLPYHEKQNILAWNPWVSSTNINGVLYEDHFVEFNAHASTNPAIILIEYALPHDDGTVERYTSEVITNSYPDTVVLEMQSGSKTCYWYRCAVPLPFIGYVRDWNGEVLFGAPHGSGKGFDLLGTLVVDDGNNLWVGATTNHMVNGVEHRFKNGINVTQESAFGG